MVESTYILSPKKETYYNTLFGVGSCGEFVGSWGVGWGVGEFVNKTLILSHSISKKSGEFIKLSINSPYITLYMGIPLLGSWGLLRNRVEFKHL